MTNSKLKNTLERLQNPAWVCFVWFGLTAGVALLAIVAIFAAEAATRPVSLDVARTVFELLSKAEFVLLIVLLMVVRVTGRTIRWWPAAALLALIMIAQAAWLIPTLSARTDMILGGTEPPASIAHAAYSISTLIKLGILLVMGFSLLPAARTPT